MNPSEQQPVRTVTLPLNEQQVADHPTPTTSNSGSSQLPDYFRINHRFMLGKRKFSVTDGKNVIWTANANIVPITEYMQVYEGETTDRLLYRINFSKLDGATVSYSITDTGGKTIAILRRNIVKSAVKSQWEVSDATGNEIAMVDQSTLRTILMRFIPFVTQYYVASVNDQPACIFKGKFVLFSNYFKIDVNIVPGQSIDKAIWVIVGIIIDTHRQHQS